MMDWEKIGLKCGIEIHQQLEGKKLFCSCPTRIRDDTPDFAVERKLRAVMGETGEFDAAALAEMRKNKTYVYQGYSDTTCLVEVDEEPPHRMNQEALEAALQTALLMNAQVIDDVQIMRKTVVDGSNTSGFQRTSLVARNGTIKTSLGQVTIPNICIEEDACKIIKKEGNTAIYNLSRLGIPLIEIATGPDIKTPEHCQEVALQIGMILRSTGTAKRGLGTIRQDVNVSIVGGTRVEVKGAQDLRMVPTIVAYEVLRQQALIEVKNTLHQPRSANKTTDVSSIFKNTQCSFIKKTLENEGKVFGLKEAGFKGILGKETQPGRRIGSEVSDYAKIAAGVGGIIHSDEDMKKYKISDEEITQIKDLLNIGDTDAFVLCADQPEKAKNAVDAAEHRLGLLRIGVIPEVRNANPDGTSSYMRPMPGAARMYPETDTIPMRTDISHITLPELLDVKAERFQKEYGIGKDLANLIVRYGDFDLFEDLAKNCKNVKPSFIGETIMSLPDVVGKKIKKEISVEEEQWRSIFAELNADKISKDALEKIMQDIAQDLFDLKKYELMTDADLEKELKSIIKDAKGAPFNAVMGQAMAKLKGKADGKKVIELLKKLS